VRPKRSKWSASLLSRIKLLKLFWTRGRVLYSPFWKLERKKRRGVANAGFPLYLQMSWLAQFIDPGLSHWSETPEGLDKRLMVLRLLLGGGVRGPIDQGNFDNNQAQWMIQMVLESIFSRAQVVADEVGLGHEFSEVSRIVLDRLNIPSPFQFPVPKGNRRSGHKTPRKYGLYGPPASGKSTTVEELAKQGLCVYDAEEGGDTTQERLENLRSWLLKQEGTVLFGAADTQPKDIEGVTSILLLPRESEYLKRLHARTAKPEQGGERVYQLFKEGKKIYDYVVDGGWEEVAKLVGGLEETANAMKSKKLAPVYRYDGVMSGWRFTSMIDTLLNSATLHVLATCVGASVSMMFFKGDDLAIEVPTEGDAAAITLAYAAVPLKVDPSSSWVSSDRDEFLQYVYDQTDGSRRGYPIRAVGGIIARSSGSVSPDFGPEEIITGCQRLISRGMDPVKVNNLMFFLLNRCLSAPRDWIYDYAHTPRSLGGGGLSPWSSRFFKLREKEKRYDVLPPKGFDWMTSEWLERLGFNARRVGRRRLVPVSMDIPHEGGICGEGVFFTAGVGKPSGPGMVMPHSRVVRGLHLENTLVEQAVRAHDVGLLREYCAPGARGSFDLVEQTCTRGVFSDWVLGRLPYSIPPRVDMAEEVLTTFGNDYHSSSFSALLRRGHRTSRHTVQLSAVSCESALRGVLLPNVSWVGA
jgi:hypothetical protein